MSALGRVAAATSITFNMTDDYEVGRTWGGGATAAGIAINADSSMKISAVYGAVSIISETTGALPLHMYEDLGDRGKRMATEHPLDEKLHDQPNDLQTALEFREMLTAFALLRGRGIAEPRKKRGGRDFDLIPLHPDLLVLEHTRSGKERYRYTDPHSHVTRVLLAEELLIVRGRFGRSVIDFARDSLGLARQMDIYAGNLFARGARPSGVLTHQKLLSPKARRNLRKALDEYAAGGDNAGRPMLLEEGMTWAAIGVSNKDAEFLESRKFSVAEIARWFRVPPHKLQDLERATNNNIEMQSMEFVVDTMVPWCERWEQSIRRDLIGDRKFFAEHILAGLLRGDTKSRYEAYAMAIQWGWMSPNDARRLENQNPYVGGDLYQRPLNMEPIGSGNSTGAVAYIDGSDGKVISLEETTRGYLRALVRDGAARAIRKESASIAKVAERTGAAGAEWRDGVHAFYREHAEFVGTLLHIPAESAEQYVASRAAHVLEAGPSALAADFASIDELTNLSLERADVLRLPAAA